jgi:hypothetical protein
MRIRSKMNMRWWTWKNYETTIRAVYRVAKPRRIAGFDTEGPYV